MIRVLNNNLNKYNIIFQELKVNKKVSIDLQDKIKELLQLHEDLINSNNILEEDENLELFKICYSLEKKKNIIIKSKEDETILSENDEYNREFYIIPSQLNDIIFINKYNNKPIKNIKMEKITILLNSLKLIKEKNNILYDIDNEISLVSMKFL